MSETPDPPDAPDSLPNYLAEGLPKQDTDVLEDVAKYVDDLLAYRTAPITDAELSDTAEPADEDSSEKGVVVKEKVQCGDESCHCMNGNDAHGPYLYRYYREGGQLKSEYKGKPGK